MNRLASAAIAFALAWPIVASGQDSQASPTRKLQGIGVDEHLDQPSQLVRARDASGAQPPPFVFVQLIVARNSVETLVGNYAVVDLDARITALEGTPVLLALEGMPATTDEEAGWQSYVLAIAERYRGKVVGYVLGRARGAAPSQIETYAYLLKLAAIQIRSVDRKAVVLEGDGRSHEPQWIDSLYQQDIAPYFDGIAVTADDNHGAVTETVARHDPSAQVIVSGAALEGSPSEIARRVLVEIVSNLVQGSAATTFSGSDEAVTSLVGTASRLSNLLDGDVVALDEGEAALDIKLTGRPVEGLRHDLFFNATTGSTLLVYWPELADAPRDDLARLDVRLKSFVPGPPELHDPGGARMLPVEDYDYDMEDNVASVRVPVLDRPLILEYRARATGTTVTASVGLRVSEIIARHQRAQTRQDNLVASYFASVRDEIHFRPTAIDSFDVIIESRFYSDREGSEWEELSFSFNGARWGSDRPAFPLLQPEKVLSLPLDLQLDQDYEYELKGRGRVGDRECYVVRFEPLSGSRSLYAGSAWIDAETFVKLKVQTVQTELSAPVVSNAEVYTYEKQGEGDLSGGTGIYLLTRLSRKQLVLIAGRNLLVEKESVFYDFHVNSPGFEAARQAARASDHIMLTDTDEGLRYFVKRGGERQVADEPTRSAKALAMGVTVDPSFDFPLPIVGLNYLDFDFLDRDAQFALLFGGIFALGNIQKSNLWGGSFDTSFDFFGIAIQSNDVVFDQDGKVEEASLRTVPASTGVNFGWQFTDFQKLTARYDLSYDWYGRDETTAEAFVTPTSTFTNGFTLGYELRRRGYSLLGSSSYAKRAAWEPWGDVSTFDPDTQSYWKYRVVFGKDFFFKTFHKIHVDAGYFGGERIDRFTSYQFGLFDETRIRGVPSTAVRFKELILARGSYSFNVFDQFRFELFYDRAWGDDPEQGLSRVSFSGLGVGLHIRGPWHTIVRVDVGKSFLPKALRGAGTVVTQFLVLKPL